MNEKNIEEYIKEIIKIKPSIYLEIGFGSGENLLNIINKQQDSFFIGCEPYLNGLTTFINKLQKKYYERVRLFRNDVRVLLDYLPNNFFDKIIILFPDPWPKLRHEKRRLLNEANIKLIIRTLKKNGKLYVATDVKDYFFSIMKNFDNLNSTVIVNKENYLIKPRLITNTRYMEKTSIVNKNPFYLKVKKILD